MKFGMRISLNSEAMTLNFRLPLQRSTTWSSVESWFMFNVTNIGYGALDVAENKKF